MARWVSPLIAVAIGVLFFVRSGCASGGFDADDLAFDRVEHSYFAVDLPKEWKVLSPAAPGTVGSTKREYKSKEYVELSWTVGEPLSRDELREQGDAMLTGLGYRAIKQEASSHAGLDRYEAVLEIRVDGKTVWSQFALIQCQATNIGFTLFAVARGQEDAEGLGRHVIDSFECRGDGPAEAMRQISLSTDFGDDWGYSSDNDAEIIARKDSAATVVVSRTGSSIAEPLRQKPADVARVLGSMMGGQLTVASDSLSRLVGVGGSSIAAVRGVFDGGQVAIGSLDCADRQFYILFAMVEPSESNSVTPTALLSHLGCPKTGRSIASLKSTCELGIKDFCNENDAEASGAEAAPAGD